MKSVVRKRVFGIGKTMALALTLVFLLSYQTPAKAPDPTMRSNAEEALRQSEERFSKAFQSSPAPLVISEIATGRFIDVNDRWVDMLGYSREAQIGRTSKEVGIWSDPSERDRIVANLEKANFFKNEPIRFRTKSGNDNFALWSAEVITLDGREVLLSLILDETERRGAEAALAARTRMFLTTRGVYCSAAGAGCPPGGGTETAQSRDDGAGAGQSDT